MIVDMALFAFMAMKYKYVNKTEDSDNEELNQDAEKKASNAVENPAFKHNDDDV